MRFVKGLIQHRNCTDLQLEVIRVVYYGDRYTKIKAYYHRADFGCGGYRLDPTSVTFTIMKSQYKNWRRVG